MLTFISPYSDVTSLGPRWLSSYLRSKGHQVQLILLPYLTSEVEYKADFIFRYDERLLDQISEACKGSDYIGVSLMTNYYFHAIDLTRRLRKDHPDTPLLWGGIHPTLAPEECIEHADYVCVGEGELAADDFANRIRSGASLEDTPNFWVRTKDGEVRKNEPRHLIENLDVLPHPDYDPERQLVRDQKSGLLVEMTDKLLQSLIVHPTATKHRSRCFYQTITSRGCPYVCSFCCWSALNRMYEGENNMRRRSIPSVVDEIVKMRERLPFIESITFSDDQFMAAPTSYLEEFRDHYRDKVGLPFQILAGPSTINEPKMDILVAAGLRNVQIGVQTASQKTMRDVYDRPLPNERVVRCAEVLQKYKDRIAPPIYDFILDNPWESDDDLVETLDFIIDLPRPFHLQIFSLVFFPGTEIYNKAKREGKLPSHQERVYISQYNNRRITYLNLLFSMASHGWPRSLLRLLLRPALRKSLGRPELNRLYRGIYDLYRGVALLPHRVKSMANGGLVTVENPGM